MIERYSRPAMKKVMAGYEQNREKKPPWKRDVPRINTRFIFYRTS